MTMPTMKEIRRVKKIRVAASLFSGCGGSSTGLSLAGYDVRYANEFIPSAADAYALNFPKTHLDRRDVRKIKAKDILKACRVKVGELDYLDASPPCKLYSHAAAFSREGKRHDEVILYSERVKQRVDDLFDEFIRLLKGVKPKVFCVENVPGLASKKHAGSFVEFHTKMSKAGYNVVAKIIDPSAFGLPQRRRRLVFIGVRKDLKQAPVFPRATDAFVTVRDVLPYVTHIHEGGNGYQDSRRPGPTIVATAHRFDEMCSMSSPGYVSTATENRKLTIKELYKLFALPSDFKLIGDFKMKWERIGRIHVPLQVYYIAKTLSDEVLS